MYFRLLEAVIRIVVNSVQIDNQLPFSVYPQVLYPLPPPPTVASATGAVVVH